MERLQIGGLRAQYRPGEPVALEVQWPATLEPPPGSRVTVTVWELHRTVAQLSANVGVPLTWTPPLVSRAAYGLEARLTVPDGRVVAQGTGALDVADFWWRTPRMGFVTEFSPGETLTETRRRMRGMVRLHLTCLDFYDWMYTHHQYLPPEDNFVDTMGRHLSLLAVRRKVRLARELGMAPLAYAPLYGAEESFVREHPEWALYRSDGVAFNVARLFYMMDFRLGSGWTGHLLEQYRAAIQEVGFAGLMIDQFGYPKKALPYPGSYGTPPIDLGDHCAPLIDAADAVVRNVDPDARVVFHALNNWPVRKVAAARHVLTYIQVYSPHRTYRDLRDLIHGARTLAPEKPVVLGALPDRHANQPALLLLTAVIHACGGYQLLLGEGDGRLISGYFPDYVRLPQQTAERMEAYYDFLVRYGPLMDAPPEEDVSETHAGGVTEDYSFAGAPTSSSGLPGHIWTIVREHQGLVSIQLINLLESDGLWNSPQPEPPVVEGLEVTCRQLDPVHSILVASPDWTGGTLQELPFTTASDPQMGHVVRFRIPRLVVWDLVVMVPVDLCSATELS